MIGCEDRGFWRRGVGIAMARASTLVTVTAICAAIGIAWAQDSSAPAPIQLPGIASPPQAEPSAPESPSLPTTNSGESPPAAPMPLSSPGPGGGAAGSPSGQTFDGTQALRGTSSAEEAPLDLGVKPPSGDETAPATGAEPGEDSLIAPAEQRHELHPSWPAAVLRGLNKVTARVTIVQAPIGTPVMFGRLEITARYCYKRPPEEPPEVTAYFEIADKRAKDPKLARVFSGWMFASSPGLSGLEHPTYDVWLIDCKASTPEIDFGSAPKTPAPKELDAKQPDKRQR
jgi:hypothetical protein